AIGPMTNIATLFTLDPEIPHLLKSLVMMAGNFTPIRSGYAPHIPSEWNMACDPHAAAIVYRAPGPLIRSIRLELTTRVTMHAHTVRERFQHKLLRPVLDFAEVWFRKAKLITFHDPLAATTIFDPSICGFDKGTVEIELQSEKLAGFTYWRPSRSMP